MPTEILVIIIAVAIALVAAFSWQGVRKLAQKHTRSAATESPHKIHLAKQQVVFIYNPTKNGAEDAKTLITRSASKAGWPTPIFMETTAADPGYSMASAALEASGTSPAAPSPDWARYLYVPSC